VVVVEIDGVVNAVLVASEPPPDEAAYQLIVPALAAAPNVSVTGPHGLVAGVVPVMVGTALTVTDTVLTFVEPQLLVAESV
jgi:hypothetical protein